MKSSKASSLRTVLLFLATSLGATAFPQGTQRVTVSSSGSQTNLYSSGGAISADGRFVAFWSDATNLVANDTNGQADVFVRDRTGGTTRRMSLASDGAQADDFCFNPTISGDGSFVGFNSRAGNLVAGDTNGIFDFFLRDRVGGTTERVSVAWDGSEGNGESFGFLISSDGRFAVFSSESDNLVPGDTNGVRDVFLRDRLAGTTERISVASDGSEASASSFPNSISAEGRFVAFESGAPNLVAGDTNSRNDVFLRDRAAGTTEIVSLTSSGALGNGNSSLASMSPDGRFVAFESGATNLVQDDTNAYTDVFVRDRASGTTERVSVATNGGQGNRQSFDCSVSADGRYVAFVSRAWTLVAGDTNLRDDVFVHDRVLGTTQRVSVDSGGAVAVEHATTCSMSEDGRWVVFASYAGNLVPGDTNGTSDVFVRDLEWTSFTSLCDPGQGGNTACPCSNPAGGPTRGCDNSSSTGGAVLSASGVTHLSADTLVFATTGEKPTALSIVLQGNVFVAGGLVYGQGTRCVSGSLKRLYSKSAVGGSITAPDFGAGDLSVSAQSAAKGDWIQPGQPRWYTVYYRDPIVLGGCPSSSTFNATQTGQVSWSP